MPYTLIIINSTICELTFYMWGVGGRSFVLYPPCLPRNMNPKEDVSGQLEKLPKVVENIWAGRRDEVARVEWNFGKRTKMLKRGILFRFCFIVCIIILQISPK